MCRKALAANRYVYIYIHVIGSGCVPSLDRYLSMFRNMSFISVSFYEFLEIFWLIIARIGREIVGLS